MNKIDLYAKLADMKDIDYKNTLAISVLLELLMEKGLVTKEDFIKKANELDII